MQPYFIPYIGYFSLIEQSDLFLILDTAPYIRHGWINRNRILKPNKNTWQYTIIPLKKHSREEQISNIEINYNDSGPDKVIRQLNHYTRNQPHNIEVLNLLENIFNADHKTIASLNKSIIENICILLGINTPIKLYSEVVGHSIKPKKGQDWALDACKIIQPNTYLNPINGMNLFQKKSFEKENVQVTFLEQKIEPYNQHNELFIDRLSIIDILLNNSLNFVQEQLYNINLSNINEH